MNFKNYDSFLNESEAYNRAFSWCKDSLSGSGFDKTLDWKLDSKLNLFIEKYNGRTIKYDIKNDKFKHIPVQLQDYEKQFIFVRMEKLETLKGFANSLYSLAFEECNALLKIDKPIKTVVTAFHDCSSISSLENLQVERILLSNCNSITSIETIDRNIEVLQINRCEKLETLCVKGGLKHLQKVTLYANKSNYKEYKLIHDLLGWEEQINGELKLTFDEEEQEMIRIHKKQDSSNVQIAFDWLASGEPIEGWAEKHRGLVASKKFGF